MLKAVGTEYTTNSYARLRYNGIKRMKKIFVDVGSREGESARDSVVRSVLSVAACTSSFDRAFRVHRLIGYLSRDACRVRAVLMGGR